ncbi:hypothetical protein PQR14_36270 [Paraburkholderia bryophila]|uniref:hypothetical protein n=1 Tax=Paraburkholderia bryophila TaxID=420952 RepID=UPI0038BE0164
MTESSIFDISIIKKLKVDLEEKNFGMQWHIIANYIIDMAFGEEWFDLYCDHLSPRLAPFSQDISTKQGVAEYHLNVVRLAHMLFLLRHEEGYIEFISSLKTRDFAPVFFELHAASLLFQNGYRINFVSPTGIKGKDYDLTIEVDSDRIAVEVKSRRSGPINNAKKLSNALQEARKQLPTDMPGIIAIAIDSEYEGVASAKHAEDEVESALVSFLKSTQRVNRVLVFWHRFEGEPVYSKTMVKEWVSTRSRHPIGRDWLIQHISTIPTPTAIQQGFPSFMSIA